MVIQIEPQMLEEVSKTIEIGDEMHIVFVDWRIRRCLKCGKIG